jgi:hypothetical protein
MTTAYLGYNEQAGALLAKGLSGQIFTQISDIECELSGFFTYDRKVRAIGLAQKPRLGPACTLTENLDQISGRALGTRLFWANPVQFAFGRLPRSTWWRSARATGSCW